MEQSRAQPLQDGGTVNLYRRTVADGLCSATGVWRSGSLRSAYKGRENCEAIKLLADARACEGEKVDGAVGEVAGVARRDKTASDRRRLSRGGVYRSCAEQLS